MIDLKSILKQHPNCLNSRTSFKSVLMDTYPDEKRTVNILTIMFECGIVQKIKSKAVLEDNDFQALQIQLENEYGINSKYSNDSIKIWADAFSIQVRVSNKQKVQIQTEVKHEPIVHAPIVDNVIVEGAKSDYETTVENGAITITKFIGFDEKEIVVPNRIDGIAVKVIGENAFAKCTGIEKVVISEGITEIRNGVFSECTSLKNVSLPSSLKKIGNAPPKSTGYYSWNSPAYKGVFEDSAIVNIQLPSALCYIGNKAFSGCRSLQKIDLPNNIMEIPEHCFSYCSALKEVLLPDNLTNIGPSAFSGTGIVKIDIPVSVKKIERSAFSSCEQVTQVLLHEGLTTIEDNAFENCKALTSITIPKSVTAIGKELFDITGWHQPYDRRRNGWSTRNKNSNLVISCYAGSFGLEYARKEGYQVQNAAK